MSFTTRLLSTFFTTQIQTLPRRSFVSSNSRNLSFLQKCLSSASTIDQNDSDENSPSLELGSADDEGQHTRPTKKFVRRQNSLMPSQKFRTEERFLTHFNQLKCTDEVIDGKEAFILLKSCGKHMISESTSTKNRLLQLVWSEFEKSGVVLHTHLWNTLLSVYIENGFEFEPVEFLKEMWQKSNAEPNHTTFTLMVQSYAIRGDPIGAMKIVEFMLKNNEQITEVVYGWLVHAFAKNGDTDDINEIFNSMQKNNITPRHAVYEQLLNVYAEKGDFNNIEKTMEEMVSKSVYPTSSTYLHMLEHLVNGGHSNLIKQIWNKIDDSNSLVSELFPLTLNCISSSDYEGALFLLEKCSPMKANNLTNYQDYIEKKMFSFMKYSNQDVAAFVKASSFAENHFNSSDRFTKLVSFAVENFDDKSCSKLFECVEGRKINARDFIPYIKELIRKDDIRNITKICQLIHDNVPVTKQFKYIIGSILEKSEDNAEFSNIMNLFMTKSNSNMVKDPETLQLMKSIEEVKNNLESSFAGSHVSDIISKLHQKGISVDILIRNIVQKLNAQDHTEETLVFLKKLVQDNVSIDSHSFTKMLKMLIERKMKEEFFSFVYFMKENGMELDVHQLFQMLIMSSQSGDGVAAQYCFEKLKKSDIFEKEKLYRLLISAYSNEIFKTKPMYVPVRLNKGDTAIAQRIIHIFNEMIESGLKPLNNTLLITVKKYLLLQDVESAQELAEKYSFTIDSKLHTFVIRAYCLREDFEKAEEYFNKVQGDSNNSVFLYNEMLNVYSSTADVEKTEKLFSEMPTYGIIPNFFSHKFRIRILTSAGKYEECLSFIREGLANGDFSKSLPIDKNMLKHYVFTGKTEFVKGLLHISKQYLDDELLLRQLFVSTVLAQVKVGQLNDASIFLHSDVKRDDDILIYQDAARFAYRRNDNSFLKNLVDFLKINEISCNIVNQYYLKALDKNDNLEELQLFYTNNIDSGLNFDDKFMGSLDDIIERRGLVSFQK